MEDKEKQKINLDLFKTYRDESFINTSAFVRIKRVIDEDDYIGSTNKRKIDLIREIIHERDKKCFPDIFT